MFIFADFYPQKSLKQNLKKHLIKKTYVFKILNLKNLKKFKKFKNLKKI